MKLYINATTIKQAGQDLCGRFDTFTHFIKSGSANSVMIVAIMMSGIFYVTSDIQQYNLNMASADIKLERIKLQATKEESKRLIAIEQIAANNKVKMLAQKIHLEEVRAAANPYMVEPVKELSPINMFFNTFVSGYSIETSDGKTEIQVGMVKVNDRTYTPEQRKLMTMAFHIGYDVGFPETIQSLLLQETLAGAFGDRIGDTTLPIGKRSYGVMQMKVATSRKVLKKYKSLIPKYFPKRKTFKRLRDEEIIIRLIQDDEFNIRLAALNFVIHRKASRSWSQAVVAYNTGQGKANTITEPKKHIYYGHIIKRMISEVRPFNQKTNLTL